MDPFRYAWWWVRLKIDPTIAISPEDKVDIASRSEGLAEHIFFDAGKKDNLTMAHVAQIIFDYVKDDVDYMNSNRSSPPPSNYDNRPPFLKKLISKFVAQVIMNVDFPAEYSNGNLHDAFIDAGILSEQGRDNALTQNELDELLHVLIWSLSPGQKIALANKIPRMAEKILFTKQLKLNLKDTDLKQIIDHYAPQAHSRVMTTLKSKKDLILDAQENETLADVYISNNLLTTRQVIDVLTCHTVALFDKHWGLLQQKLLSTDNTRESEQLRNHFFEVLEMFCKEPNRSENNNEIAAQIEIREHIISIIFEGNSLRLYIDDKIYPTLHRRIYPPAPTESLSEIESSASASLATTPRNLTPRDGDLTPRSSDSGFSTPRSVLSVEKISGDSRSTTPPKQDTRDREKALKFASVGKIALEILEFIAAENDQELNNYLGKLKQDPDKLTILINLALGKNLPDGLQLVELSKTVAKSLFTYDATYSYSISEFNLMSIFYKYYSSPDQEIIDQIFKYYSDIRLQTSGVVNGELIFPKQRKIEKENYDVFIRLIRTSSIAPENKVFIQSLFSNYEHAKSLLGAPGIINTIYLLHSSITLPDGSEKKIRDNDAIKQSFPLLLKAAMNDSEEAKVFFADAFMMSLLKKILSNGPLPECEHWRNSGLAMDRAGIKKELHNLALSSSNNRNKDFFENCLITHLLLNSFATEIKDFSSQDDMLTCLLNITPITKPSTANDSAPYKQEYLAVVNITFAPSADGNKAKQVTAETLACSTKDLDDSFMLMPVKDVHSFLPEKLSINVVTPGIYSIDTLLEWNTPEKLAEKPLNRNAFKNYLTTDKEPKPKTKLLIPRPDTRINRFSEQFKDDPEINKTSGYSAFTSYTQKIITHFAAFLTAISHYVSAATIAADKSLEEKNGRGKAKSSAESLARISQIAGQTIFPPPPSSSTTTTSSIAPAMPIPSPDTLAPPAAPTAMAAEIDQNEDKATSPTDPRRILPEVIAAGESTTNNAAPATASTGATNLRIGRGRKI